MVSPIKVAKQMTKAGGPAKWAYARITEFLVGMVVGTAFNIADLIAGSIAAVTESLTYAGEQATAAFGAPATAIVDVVDDILAALATVADWAGPLGPVVYIVVAVTLLALLYRLAMAVADSVPVASSIQKFIEGSG